jgi:type IV fimbrial biogenesis protein FimT
MLSKLPLRRRCSRGRQRGVTLVESMVALAIAGVLTTVALPNLTGLRAKAAVETQVGSFNSALRRARSEAITRGQTVTVCALDADSLGDDKPACMASGNDWTGGWLVFVDAGERGDVDEDDDILRVEAAPAGVGPMVGTQRYVTYRWSGELLGIAAHFRFLPPGEPAVDVPVEGSALVCVNKPGKPRVAKEARCS